METRKGELAFCLGDPFPAGNVQFAGVGFVVVPKEHMGLKNEVVNVSGEAVKMLEVAGAICAGTVDLEEELHRALEMQCTRYHVWSNPLELWNANRFGRYLSASFSQSDLIYTQDDDCIVSEPLYRRYDPKEDLEKVVVNWPSFRMAEYVGASPLGYGAIMHRRVVKRAFDTYFHHFPIDPLFLVECDRVVIGLNRVKVVDVETKTLPRFELRRFNRRWAEEMLQRLVWIRRAEGLDGEPGNESIEEALLTLHGNVVRG